MSNPVVGAEPQQLGRYRLVETLSAGAMSTVYRAELAGATGSTKTVAIKRLHPHLADNRELVATFIEQVRITSCINHRNVIATSALVDDEGELFFVLEYVPGKSLASLIVAARERKAPVPLGVAAAIALDMLRGLHAAHEARDTEGKPLEVVHRDVSPRHVIVGADGVARVLDFGAAKAAGRAESTLAETSGTSPYLAPEQARGTLVDRRADVYAAAAVLWEMLVGRRMVVGKNDVETFDAIVRGEVIDPSTLEPRIPKALAAAITRGVADDINKRWPTARELASAIEQALPIALPKEVASWVELLAPGTTTASTPSGPASSQRLKAASASAAGESAASAPAATPLAKVPLAPPRATPAAPAPQPSAPATRASTPDAVRVASLVPSSAKLRAAPSAAPRAPAPAPVKTSAMPAAPSPEAAPPPAQPFPPSPSAPILAAAPATAEEAGSPDAEPPWPPIGLEEPSIAEPDPEPAFALDDLLAATEAAAEAWPADSESPAELELPSAVEALPAAEAETLEPVPLEPAPLEPVPLEPVPLEPVPPGARRAFPIRLVGGAVAVVVVILVLVLVTRRGPPARPTPTTTASVAAAPSSAPLPVASAPEPATSVAAVETAATPPAPPPTSDEPDIAPVTTASAPPKTPRTKPPPARSAGANTAPATSATTKPKPSKKKSCSEDPFFVGTDGLKRVRPECMK